MGDILDIITSRKSIRRYKPDPVPEEMLMKVLEAGRWAATVAAASTVTIAHM